MRRQAIAQLGLTMLLLLGALSCATVPCKITTGATPVTQVEILEQLPVLDAIDDERDFSLVNPLDVLFQEEARELMNLEDLGDLYRDYDVEMVPIDLDVLAVSISRAPDTWRFEVQMAGEEGDSGLGRIVSSGQGRLAIYLDVDLDNVSDVILTTIVTEDGSVRMVGVDSGYNELRLGSQVEAQWDGESHRLTVDVPSAVAGDHYDWLLVTGFAVSAEAAAAAVPNDRIRWSPTVDVVLPDCPFCEDPAGRSITFFDSFRFGSPCQVFESTVTKCPPPTPQSMVTLPGKAGQQGKKGWLFRRYDCGQREMEVYCSQDWVGWVDNGVKSGWFAHCPYYGGVNSQAMIDTNYDQIPEGWTHTVKEPLGSRKVDYIYKFGPPHDFLIYLYKGTQLNKCSNLQLSDDPWALPGSHCSYP